MRLAFCVVALAPLLSFAEEPPQRGKDSTGEMRITLKNGWVVSGPLKLQGIAIDTAYGTLTVPTREILELRIGKQSDPDLLAEIRERVKELGAADAETRKRASVALARMGSTAMEELRQAAKGADAEVRRGAAKVLEAIDADEAISHDDELGDVGASDKGAEGLPDEDELVTVRFTVRGSVRIDKLDLDTPFGPLSIPKKVLRELTVIGAHQPTRSFQVKPANGEASPIDTGISVRRGDRITVEAKGSMQNKYEDLNCTPDGDGEDDRSDVDSRGEPAEGRLLGRIGPSGKWFPMGAHWKGKADADGVLFLAVALDPEDAKGTTGGYEVTVEVGPE